MKSSPMNHLFEHSTILPPPILKPWLSHQSSLTDKLKQINSEVEIKVLNQAWILPSWWDNYNLAINTQKIRCREIIIQAAGRACWFGRTIIPVETYEKKQALFERLNHEPLGAIIFSEPTIRKCSMLNYQINHHCIEYHWLPAPYKTTDNQPLWLRLATFTVDNESSFYLAEIFLPGLLEIIQ